MTEILKQWFSRYELSLHSSSTRKPFGSRYSSSKAYREDRFSISIIYDALFD